MGFSEEQKRAVTWYKGPLLVLGTPGSGKTTVIVNRIIYLTDNCHVNENEILVITFTRAAAISMKARYEKLTGRGKSSVRFSTFHAFFYWIIQTAYKRGFNVLDEKSRRDTLRRIMLSVNPEEYDSEELLTSIINQIGRLESDMIGIDNYYSADMPMQDFRRIYDMYVEEKKRTGVLDFDDMVTECYRLLKSRPDILNRLQGMYPFIMVDEFQDTNRIQYEILKMLAAPEFNLFAVGDDDQSIYGFRGARPDIMLSFKKEFINAEIMTLSKNFRCPREITDYSSRIISGNKRRYKKSLESAVASHGEIIIVHPKTVSEENQLIAERIRNNLINGMDAKDIAILYRTNSEPRRLLYKLREYGIPFSVRDVLPDIFSDNIVVPMLNYLHFAMGDNRRKLFITFMNKPVRYISRNMLSTERVGLKELLRASAGKEYLRVNIMRLANELDTIRRLNPYSAISYIRKAVGYDKYLKEYAEEKGLDYDEMMDKLDEVQAVAKECEGYDDFISYIEDYRELLKEQAKQSVSKEKNDDESKVQLMTLHSAKGLEFRDVHIIECVEGIIPHKKSRTDSELEEERRMLYVGVTRAKERLYIYAPRKIGEKPVRESGFLPQ